jgi:MOSC domain-containing protein YiiM
MARLLSVNVGLPRDVDWNGKTTRTAVWKSPVEGRLTVRTLNIEGVYQMDSYHYWEHFLGRSDFSFGQFGENFTD